MALVPTVHYALNLAALDGWIVPCAATANNVHIVSLRQKGKYECRS
jgi:hypothetical protein